MPELERRLAHARPEWPEPPAGLEGRILGSLGLEADTRSPAAWLRRVAGSRRARLLAVGLVLAGSGTALAVTLAGRSGSTTGAEASIAFGAPQVVGRADGFLNGTADVAVDATGTPMATWGQAGRAVVATRAPTGSWGPPQVVLTRGARASRPQIAAGSAGAVVVWRERLRGRAVTQRFSLPGGGSSGTLTTHLDVRWRVMARALTASGSWGPPVPISAASQTSRDGYAPQVVATGAGDAVAAYAARSRVWTVARTAEHRWTAPLAVPLPAGSGVPSDVHLAAAPGSGWALVVWSSHRDEPSGRLWRTWSAVRAPDGRWDDPTALGPPSPGKSLAAGAINDHGEAVVAWGDGGGLAGADGRMQASIRSREGSWGDPIDVAPSSAPGRGARRGAQVSVGYWPANLAVGIDGSGGAVVSVPGRTGTAIARRPPGGDWRAPRVLRADAGINAIAADRSGGLVIASARNTGRLAYIDRFDRMGAPSGSTTLRSPGAFSLALAEGADGTSALAGIASGRLQTRIIGWVAPKGGRG